MFLFVYATEPRGRNEQLVDRRFDHRSGRAVWFDNDRQSRPNLPSSACPFCPGGLEAPEPYEVRCIENRWPPLPDGRCEVLLFCPEHDGSLAELGAERIRRVVDLWAERTECQGRRDDVDYVLIFENRGAEVGATIAHPHGQLYALPEVPPVALAELDGDGCPICSELAAGHLVDRVGVWSARVPHAASWPYELLLAPDAHIPDLVALDDDQRNDLAALLADALVRLDCLFDAPMPYMLWIHQRPTDGGAWPQAHVHIEVVPLFRQPGVQRFVAAGELGSGVHFNPLLPEDAAAQLRAVQVVSDAT